VAGKLVNNQIEHPFHVRLLSEYGFNLTDSCFLCDYSR